MLISITISWRRGLLPRWKKKWSDWVLNRLGQPVMLRGISLMVTRVIASIYRPIFPLKIFGQLFFTATKRDRRFRRIKGFLVSVVRLKGFWLMPMVLSISISGRNRLLARRIIGCRRFLARVGTRFFGFMARLSLGLTRLGDQGKSSY